MENWVVTAKRADFNSIADEFRIDPVTARLIVNRGCRTADEIDRFLHAGAESLYDPLLMKDMEKAAEILKKKIAGDAHIRVIGDYDIDGLMASFIMKKAFDSMGARVDVDIPDRIKDGYGVSVGMIEKAHADGVDTIVTCDNGISAREAVRAAKHFGMTVVVTDHHEVVELPDADAVIDPKQSDCTYPYKELCGASVALKLMKALNAPIADRLLQYAAFATVGDVVDLTGENRVIVKEGLKRLHKTENIGLKELIRVNGLKTEEIDPYHIGFVLGPCLNASGRLGSAMKAFALLAANDSEKAGRLALELKALNDSRKAMTEDSTAEAEKILTESDLINDKVYVIYLSDCLESLAGIIAGRIREKYNHPVFVLTKASDGVKGSGRSIETYQMLEGLIGCSDLLDKFGGHAMAAGLSIPEDKIPFFRRRLNEQCLLSPRDFQPKVSIDIPMPISYVTEHLLEEFKCLEPFGKANPRPVFAMKSVRTEGTRLIGAKHSVLKTRLCLMDGFSAEGIAFHDAQLYMESLKKNPIADIVYYPTLNEYAGRRTIQAVITHLR